jgi:hypothetical protein
MKKCLIILAILGIIVPAAHATRAWNTDAVGNWSDGANWSGGSIPGTLETAQFNTGTLTLDTDIQIGQYLGGNVASTNTGILNLTTGANLTVSKASSEVFCVQKVNGTYEVVNHSAGTLRVFHSGGNGTGEFRLVTGSSNTTGSATYNLSGTAILDTEVFSKGLKNAPATFNATGGTLVIRTKMTKFGLAGEGYGFNLGQAKFEIGAIGTVKAIELGDGSNKMDFTANAGATMVFDIASATSFDKISQYGAADNVEGASLIINLLDGYTPEIGTTFDIWTFYEKNRQGTGTFGMITPGFDAQWIDTNGDLTTDTLRLTAVPEPVTLVILGLGLLGIRRK